MVGVPRSKGCHLCVRRRIKCDQAKPQCANCTRYGAECPGYDRSLKFVEEKHRIKPKKASDNPSHASETTPLPPLSESSSSEVSFPTTWQRMFITPKVARAQHICNMLSNMYAVVTPAEGWFLNSWFVGIEPRLGSQVALDSATMCLVLQVLGKSYKDHRLIGESRSLYGKSLQALQAVLNHKSEWKTSETLCATTMLCYFELFAGTKDSGSWMKHASGVGWLIQQRGHDAYLTEWDKAILKSFRISIIMDALFSEKDCFLSRPPWQALLRRLSKEDRDGSKDDKVRNMVDQYLVLLAKVPTIFRQIIPIHALRMAGVDAPIDNEAFAPLMRYAEQILQDLRRWSQDLYTTFAPPTEIPSRDPTSPFPLVYRFDNVWEGSLYMGYWATCVILQYSLQVAGGRLDTVDDNRELCTNIFRSLETVGAGIMGPYRIGYSLRIAYEPAPPHIQQWIKGLLQKYGEVYAGLREETFPDNEERLERWEGVVDERIPAGM